MSNEKRQQQAKWIRMARKVHRQTGIILFVFFFIIGITGLLLGWKKHSNGYILPKSYKGISTNSDHWLTLDSLQTNAFNILRDSVSPSLSRELERIDVRPYKGMVKFVFVEDFVGIQLDLTTGKLLHIEQRRSDFIENIHDGSILDHIFKTSKEQIKLVYTSIMGLALILFTITGFWLWYGPKKMRRQ